MVRHMKSLVEGLRMSTVSGILVLLALSTFSGGCGLIEFNPDKHEGDWVSYHIPEGKYRSEVGIQSIRSNITFIADLTDAEYDTLALGSVEMLDWNKLYGISSYNIHKNSHRIGFRFNKGYWEFAAYWYVDGVRGYQYLGKCDTGDQPVFTIHLQHGECYYEMHGQGKFTVPASKPDKLYRAFPYFGGNLPAPTGITVRIKELST